MFNHGQGARTAKGKSSDFNSVQVTVTNLMILANEIYMDTNGWHLAKYALKKRRKPQCQSSPAIACSRVQKILKVRTKLFSLQAVQLLCRNIYALNSRGKQRKTSQIISWHLFVKEGCKTPSLGDTYLYWLCSFSALLGSSIQRLAKLNIWSESCNWHISNQFKSLHVRSARLNRSKAQNMHLSWTGERAPVSVILGLLSGTLGTPGRDLPWHNLHALSLQWATKLYHGLSIKLSSRLAAITLM